MICQVVIKNTFGTTMVQHFFLVLKRFYAGEIMLYQQADACAGKGSHNS